MNSYLPDRFLVECQKTEWTGGDYRAVAALAKSRGADIDKCNEQIREARGYQDDLKAKESSDGVKK